MTGRETVNMFLDSAKTLTYIYWLGYFLEAAAIISLFKREISFKFCVMITALKSVLVTFIEFQGHSGIGNGRMKLVKVVFWTSSDPVKFKLSLIVTCGHNHKHNALI